MPTPENEQKIRYLSRYRRLNQRIDRLLEEQYRWKCLAMKVTQNFSPTPGGGESGSPIERPMDKVLEIDAEINREIREVRKKLAVCREIQGVLPKMEQDIQSIEHIKKKEVDRGEHRRR